MNHNYIYNRIEELKSKLIEISLDLWNNPELGYFEYHAAKALTTFLKENDFSVEMPAAGMETAFIAEYKSEKEGPTIGLVVEYDALPDIGHACGHNLFSLSGCGAAVALKDIVDNHGGKIKVIGSPCEEGTHPDAGGKVVMVEKGIFEDVDMAIMCHGESETYLKRYLVASGNMTVKFYGTSIHAGGDVTNGRNAVTALNVTLSNINAIRQHFYEHTVVNSIISDGGTIANTYPKETEMKITIRAPRRDQHKEIIRRIKNCVIGAATVTECEYEIVLQKHIYEDTRPNDALAKLFARSLDELDVEYTESNSAKFAWDIGNVSYVVPTLSPYIKIGPKGILCHSKEFLEASRSEGGHKALVIAAKAMAATVADYITSEEIREEVKKEFDEMI